MINNVRSLLDKSKNFANKNNVTVQQAVQYFMFERFLDRLSHSQYKENFVLKGGFLLSSIMGINVRSTMDMDANIYGMNFNEIELTNMIDNIIKIDIKDNVSFEFNKTEIIREDNEYGGLKVKLTGIFFNLKVPFHIDMSTGDIITPMAVEYNYRTILDNEQIDIYTYNYETIIAEKLQTVLVRSNSNSRMKDLYDLYYFVTYKLNDIDKEILNTAIEKTFINRKSEKLLRNMETILNVIENDLTQNKLWNDYSSKYEYAKDLKFRDVIKQIRKISK